MILLSKGKSLLRWSNVEGIMTLFKGKRYMQGVSRVHLKLTSEDGKKQFIISLDKYEVEKLIKYVHYVGLIKKRIAGHESGQSVQTKKDEGE